MLINFRNKIKADRPISSRNTGQESMLQLQYAFESDRGRIINSAAIRRLQQKTQVFPLERNAAVRSRLTHSLEVQQVGRFIVQSIFRQLQGEASQYGLEDAAHAVESLVEMACLMHDIGNPPFGHSGEAAINRWFRQHAVSYRPAASLTDDSAAELWRQLATELQQFEGNAQGIRIIATLQSMNLTYTQSACIMKYTRPASLTKAEVPADFSYLMKKPGFYHTEQDFIRQQNAALQIQPQHRHPLSYIMEAADDISYCLADIEDAVEKDILSLERVAELLKQQFSDCYPELSLEELPPLTGLGGKQQSFHQMVDEVLSRADRKDSNRVYEFFIGLRVKMIHPLVQHAASQFVRHIDAIYHGSFNRALLEDHSPCHAITKTFKAVALQHVFNHKEVELLEMQGFKIISGLLDTFAPLLQLSSAHFAELLAGTARDLPLEQRLLKRLPKKYLQCYKKALQQQPYQGAKAEVYEVYLRCRLLQDHLSGMTDHFAADEYQALVLCQ